MSAKKSKGFTDEERAAMRERAQELKAEARANKKKAEGESALLAKKPNSANFARGGLSEVRIVAVRHLCAPRLRSASLKYQCHDLTTK